MSEARILLVDDEPGILEIVSETLEGEGYSTITAHSGANALDILRVQTVDLAILDMRMPQMTGMELLEHMNSRDIDTDVIFLTGYGSVDDAVNCLQLGAVDFMLKPFNVAKLVDRVDKALSERQLRLEQRKVGSLVRMLDFSSAVSNQSDMGAMLREFLSQVEETFSPDGLALFLSPENGNTPPPPILRGFFRGEPAITRWFGRLGHTLLERNRPKLLDPLALEQAKKHGNSIPQELPAVSAMITPVAGTTGKTGALCLVREPGHSPYSMHDLHLATVFASHAAAALENLRSFHRLRDLNMEIITSYVRAVEAKDTYTRGHSERVSTYARTLGEALALSPAECDLVATAGLLHDIGKIGIPDSILNKPSALTDEEFTIMKRHPEVGRNIVNQVSALGEVLPAIYHHHERFDGSGYPGNLAGGDIPLLSRIISVVDGYEAMISDRAYRKGMPTKDALNILRQGAGTQWDPHIVNIWIRLVAQQKA